jgi:hypothetical protein
MSKWKFWEWLAYCPILAAAVLLTVIQGSKDMTTIPAWLPSLFISTNWNYVPLILVLIGSFVFILRALGWVGAEKSDAAELRLHIFDSDSPPRELSSSNISGWYFFRNKSNGITATCTLLVVFDNPIIAKGLKSSFIDMKASDYEVKEFNSRFSVIVFTGDVRIGSLLISVT